jgi:very-short-patch-repair endonuclease
MLSHASAAELAGLAEPSDLIHVSVPTWRRIAPRQGIVLHHRQHVDALRHPGRVPPQTRIEETVLDLCEAVGSIDQAVGWLTRACGRRLTTAPRLLRAMTSRTRVRWRAEMTEALADVAVGCLSVLERRYLRGVERAHGLPTGVRQAVRRTPVGTRYDDVRYVEYATIVELDGRVAHPDDQRGRDRRRDNVAVAAGDRVLRYGWSDVTDAPCAVAAQVATALRQAGWTGGCVRVPPIAPLHRGSQDLVVRGSV